MLSSYSLSHMVTGTFNASCLVNPSHSRNSKGFKFRHFHITYLRVNCHAIRRGGGYNIYAVVFRSPSRTNVCTLSSCGLRNRQWVRLCGKSPTTLYYPRLHNSYLPIFYGQTASLWVTKLGLSYWRESRFRKLFRIYSICD